MSKILIVDDSVTMRESLSFILNNEGHEIVQATNGKEGLDIYSQTKDCDLIITDINMPEMNGIDFLINIRKISKDIPVLVLTTETDSTKIEEAKKYKANAWLEKPYQQDDLLDVIQKLLAG